MLIDCHLIEGLVTSGRDDQTSERFSVTWLGVPLLHIKLSACLNSVVYLLIYILNFWLCILTYFNHCHASDIFQYNPDMSFCV